MSDDDADDDREPREWAVSFLASKTIPVEAETPQEAREIARDILNAGYMEVHETTVTDDAGVWVQFNEVNNIEDSMGADEFRE